MSRLLPLAILLCASMAPLAAATAQDMLGTWVIDGDAMWEIAKPNVPPEKHEMAKALMLTTLGQMRFVVSADKVVTTAPGGETEETPYRIARIDGDAITMASTKDGETTEVTMTMSGDRATLSRADNQKIPLKRPAAEAAPAPGSAAP